MRRREFIALLGGVAVAWPIALRAQQPERTRRIGVLLALKEDDSESKPRLAAFAQGLQQLGWTVGQNVGVDYRWAGISADEMGRYAAELVALAPDVILAQGSTAVAWLHPSNSLQIHCFLPGSGG
jgi:putative ABC transport system substrate-binding protein